MSDERPRPGAWVAWADLEQEIRAEFPDSDPLHVTHAVETGEVEYRLQCDAYDGGDLVPDPFDMAWFGEPNILPYRLKAQDWRLFDRAAGRFRHYPLEVSWPSVCRFLEPMVDEIGFPAGGQALQTDGDEVEADYRRWIVALFRADPKNDRRWKHADVIDELQKRSTSRFNDAAYNRAWGAAVRITGVKAWSKPGPRGQRTLPTKH